MVADSPIDHNYTTGAIPLTSIHVNAFSYNRRTDDLSLIPSQLEIWAEGEKLLTSSLFLLDHDLRLPGSYDSYTLKVNALDRSQEITVRGNAISSQERRWIGFLFDTDFPQALAHYPMDGYGEDLRGYAPGILHGTASAINRFGHAHGALSFDGVDDYLELSSDFDLEYRTISLWFKASSISPNVQVLFNADHPMFNFGSVGLHILEKDNKKILNTNNGGCPGPETEVAPGEWYQAVVTTDPKKFALYLNGKLVNEVTRHSRHSKNGLFNTTVSASRLLDRHFEGSLDDLKIFDQVLTEEQVFFMYNHF